MQQDKTTSVIGTTPRILNAPSRFDVSTLPIERQFLAWRERVGLVVDVVPTRSQFENPFSAYFDRYEVAPFVFDVCYSDQVELERSIARISQDSARGMVFQLFPDGGVTGVISRASTRKSIPVTAGILAVDLNQSIRFLRAPCRHITFFVQASHIQKTFADPGILHARVLTSELPIVQCIHRQVSVLANAIPTMLPQEASRHLSTLLTMILSAYGDDLGLSGSRSAIARAHMFDGVRRFIHANLSETNLTAEYVLESLNLSRPTIYRLFQHEGGLANYIQDLRLRTAASDLVRFPWVPIEDVAYSLGFSSASVFTRAFRRAFDIAPKEIRVDFRACEKTRG